MTEDEEKAFLKELMGLLPRMRNTLFRWCLTCNTDIVCLRDDLIQETLLRAWKHRDSFDPSTEMANWVFTIMRRQLLDYKKLARHHYKGVNFDDLLDSLEQPSYNGHQEAALEVLDYVRLMDKLADPNQRIVMQMMARGKEPTEIAPLIGTTGSNARKLAFRARERLLEMEAA